MKSKTISIIQGLFPNKYQRVIPQLELSVEVSEENLLRYNLTFDEIARAINQNNLDISGGQIRSDEEEMMIR